MYGEITGRRQLNVDVASSEAVALTVAVGVGVCWVVPPATLVHPVATMKDKAQSTVIFGGRIDGLTPGSPFGFDLTTDLDPANNLIFDGVR